MQHRHRARGFTLIELMVVVVILGLLLAIVGPNVIWGRDKAALQTAKTQMRNIGQAVEMFHIDKRRLPESFDDLLRFDEGGEPLIRLIPRDPWDGEYEYRKLSRRRYEIRCMGPDREANTEDDLVHPVYLRDA